MLINEVSHIVGISRKSIRYYEENGLLKPKRNNENDYRIYDEEDIQKLKIIKFLRNLDVPIRDLKLLNQGKMTLQECMEDRINKIKEEEKNYNKIKNICLEISKSNKSYNDIDITKYLEQINILNKKGFTMMNIKTNNQKKIIGAIISSSIFNLFFIFIIITITYFQLTESQKMPWFLFWFVIFILILPIISIIYNLIIRIKEINEGEEDEASKY